MGNFFISQESVDEMITDLQNEIISSQVSVNEEKYNAIHESLVEEVKLGNITLEFASEVDEMAYNKYITEATVGQALAIASVSVAGVAASILGVITHLKTKKGYETDKELNDLKERTIALKKKVDNTSREIRTVERNIIATINDYNKMAETFGSPTIRTSSIKEKNSSLKTEIDNAETAVNNIYKQSTSKTNVEQNINYNPEKAMKLREDIKQLKNDYAQYNSLYSELIGEFNELNGVRKKLNKIARSKVHSQEDKAAMDEKINNIDQEYRSTLQKIKSVG